MHYPAQHNHLVSEGSIFGGETNSRLQPAPRLEHVGEEHSERVQDRKHRDDFCLTMPSRMEFSERTSGGGAINAPAHRGSAGAAVHRQQKRRVDLHVVDTAADQLVEGFGA